MANMPSMLKQRIQLLGAMAAMALASTGAALVDPAAGLSTLQARAAQDDTARTATKSTAPRSNHREAERAAYQRSPTRRAGSRYGGTGWPVATDRRMARKRRAKAAHRAACKARG